MWRRKCKRAKPPTTRESQAAVDEAHEIADRMEPKLQRAEARHSRNHIYQTVLESLRPRGGTA